MKIDSCFRLLIVVTLSFLFVACGSDHGGQPMTGSDPTTVWPNGVQPNSKGALFPGASIFCEGGGCEVPSVGMLAAHHVDGTDTVCTVFLANGKVFTNDHCVPEEFHQGSDCSRSMEVYFAKPNGNGGVTSLRSRCQTLEYRSGDRNNSVLTPTYDYAVFTTQEKIDLPQLDFDQSGVKDREILSIYKMDIVDRYNVTGSIVKDQCEVSLGTSFAPNWNSASNLNFFMVPLDQTSNSCHLIHGNSGSPLLNAQDRVIGILQKGTDETPSLGNLFLSIFTGRRVEELPKFGIGGNFACSNLSGQNQPLGQSCLAEAKTPTVKSSNTDAWLDVNALADEYGQQYFPFFKWGMRARTKTSFFGTERVVGYPVPLCIKNNVPLGSEYKSFFVFYQDSATRDIRLPSFSIEGKLNSKLRVILEATRASMNDDLQGTLTFSPKSIEKNKSTTVEVTESTMLGFQKTPVFTQTIGQCL